MDLNKKLARAYFTLKLNEVIAATETAGSHVFHDQCDCHLGNGDEIHAVCAADGARQP
jgi:hypothetical protein